MACVHINALIPLDIIRQQKSNAAWHITLREHEWRAFEKILCSQGVSLQESSVLEIGAGDGTQALLIAKKTAKLITTDIDERRVTQLREIFRNCENVKVAVVNAEELKGFGQESFDLVIASNVLEHTQNPVRSLQQLYTVLKPGGFLAVALPNRTWKIFNALVAYLLALKKRNWRLLFNAPKVHGKYKTNRAEFMEFGCKSWENKFKNAGFKITSIIHLPFYYGHGIAFFPVLKLGNMLHLSSSFGFLLRKVPGV
jgi:ubiquinone/menaquinone biosynthesis C-methylase UbiE